VMKVDLHVVIVADAIFKHLGQYSQLFIFFVTYEWGL
jgi:hypothetical protein